MSTSPLKNSGNRLTIVLFWSACIAAQYFILLHFGVSPQLALADSSLSNLVLAAGAILFVTSMEFYRPDVTKYLYLIVWCLTLTAITVGLAKCLLGLIFVEEKSYLDFLASSTIIRGVINFLIIGASAILSLLWYNLEEQKQSTLRKSATEKLSRDAELYKLRQQLQPHFLFNSLNSISALVVNQPDQARKMIQQLSDFLRGALKKEDHEWIAFDEEIQHLRLYLEMEEMRFGHRLTTTIEADEASRTVLVPPMLLQPIVENAIKFGLYDTTENALISIRVNTSKDLLQIDVTNPYDPGTASPRPGTGFGLSSVRRRLYLLFLRNDLLETRAENKEFTTTIKIPRHDLRSID